MAKARGKKTVRSKAKAKRAKPAPAKKRTVKAARPKAARAKPVQKKAAPARKAPPKRAPAAAAKRALPKKVGAPVRRRPAKTTVIPPDRSPARSHHDMGGLPAGKVEAAEHDYAMWEKRVDAMMVLLSDKKRGLMNTDMLRRGIESLPADAYERMSYYERWIHSVTTMVLERGVVTREELDARIARLRAAAAT